MPCNDGGWPSESQSQSLKIKQLSRSNRELEALLCSTCRVLETQGYDFDLNPALSTWWDQHKKEDIARQEKELRAKLLKEEAMEIAKKPFIELTAQDRKKLRDQGLMG